MLGNVYTTQFIEDGELNESPKMYDSAAGNPVTDRLSGGVTVGTTIFPISQIIDVEIAVDIDGPTVFENISHRARIRPQVLGMYYFKSRGERRVLGDLLDPDYLLFGEVWIEDVTTEIITVGANVANILGSEDEDTLVMRLYVLNKEAI